VVISQDAVSRPKRYQDALLEVDFTSVSASLDSRPIVLTRKEHELLAFLVQNAGETIPRNILLGRVWGSSAKHRGRTLDVHIRHLRKKFGAHNGGHIETIFGIGYRFQPFL
jgi:DNA-binding response OmpR family regulator